MNINFVVLTIQMDGKSQISVGVIFKGVENVSYFGRFIVAFPSRYGRKRLKVDYIFRLFLIFT